MRGLERRPTADLIVIYLTLIVGSILVVTTIVGLVLQIRDSEGSSDLWKFEGDVIKSFTAIIIGYLAGRGVSSAGNGGK